MAATTQRPGRWYATRTGVRNLIGIESTVTDKDARIDRLIAQMSAHIERRTDRRFIPVTATKEFDYQGPSRLILGDDLVAEPTITHANDTLTLAAADILMYPLNAVDDDEPYLEVAIDESSDYFTYSTIPESAIAITGRWGYCERKYAATSLLAESLTADETAADVDDGTEFAIGMTLLLESEQVFVRDVVTNTLTLTRGMNGTTAATHADDTQVYIVIPPDDIQFSCEVLVARMIHRGDTAWADRVGTPEQGFTYYRQEPTEVKDILNRYQRLVY